MTKKELEKAIIEVLGQKGISLQIKRRFTKFSARLIIHRGHVVSMEHGVLWSGDIDFSHKETALKRLAKKINSNLYILNEQDVKFNNDNPRFEHTLIKITPKKVVVSDTILKSCYRNDKGKWALKNEFTFLVPDNL